MQKGNPWALLPIAVFLVVFIGCGILFGDFYAMPAIVGFLIALVTAFLQNPKRTFAEKLSSVTRSMGDENVMIMCLVFVLAGAFSGAVQAAGGVDSTVNFGLSILPPQIAVAGLFLIGCFISTAMGTSVGTIVALAPIAAGISEKTGVAGVIGLVKANGGIDFVLHSIRRHVHTPKGAQLGIAALSSLVDISTANNTIAIVMSGPIAKDISQEYEIPPRHTAALLDIFTSVWQGLIPYGAQLLAAASALSVTPLHLLPYLFYPILMGISAIFFILFGKNAKKQKQ